MTDTKQPTVTMLEIAHVEAMRTQLEVCRQYLNEQRIVAHNDGLEKAAQKVDERCRIEMDAGNSNVAIHLDSAANAIRALKQKPDTPHGCEGEHDAN